MNDNDLFKIFNQQDNNSQNVNNNLNNFNNQYNQNIDSLVTIVNEQQIVNQQIPKEEDELLKGYIGDNFKKIYKRPFNIYALLLGEFYLFYRKMKLLGSLVFLVRFIMIILKFHWYTIIINILLSFTVNTIYVKSSKIKIKKLLKNKPDNNKEQLYNDFYNLGNASIHDAVGGVFICIVISIITIAITLLFNIETIFTSKLSMIFTFTNTKYEGTIEYNNNAKINDNFEYELPSEYETINNNDKLEAILKTNILSPDSECKITFSSAKGYTSSKRLANQMAKYYEKNNVDNIVIKSINDILWYKFSYDLSGKRYTYITELNGKVYIYEYLIPEKANQKICEESNEKIIKSIKLK